MENHRKKPMEYDVIFVLGEKYFDHPFCGVAILRRLLEKNGYSCAVIETPQNPDDVMKFGKPRLFFGVSSGAIDSMVRNYTALNRPREDDEFVKYEQKIPDRAVIVYCNWLRQKFKDSKIVIGGTEATLRRLTHYDYWQNSLRKSILFDSRADILVYGSGEKQVLEIINRIDADASLEGIEGTCIKSREMPKDFVLLPSHEEVSDSKEKFCDMQNLLSNYKNLAQKTDNFYVLQYKSPEYTTEDLDEYYELPFSRKIKSPDLKRFQFGIVTHRGCVGNCNFCSLKLTMGDRIISRSEESIIREIEYITRLPGFQGIIDDFGGPSANMYGLDFDKDLNKSHKRLVELLRTAREIPGVRKIFIHSGIRYDMATPEYIREIAKHHISGKLKIAPEHVNEEVLKLMNKKSGKLDAFVREFNKMNCGQLTFYFMTAHPGSSMKEARELADKIKHLQYAESVQIFTPTPMTVSTCMYYTGMDPVTKKKVYVPYTYAEKKEQKRILDLETKRQNRIKNAPKVDPRVSKYRGRRVSTNRRFSR
jgi:radical SAM superfamily enzyme YgiQ (UPF0313 family)